MNCCIICICMDMSVLILFYLKSLFLIKLVNSTYFYYAWACIIRMFKKLQTVLFDRCLTPLQLEFMFPGPIPDPLLNWVTEVSNVSADQRWILLTNLKAAAAYQFRVSAVNSVGEGSPSEPSNVVMLPQEGKQSFHLSRLSNVYKYYEMSTNKIISTNKINNHAFYYAQLIYFVHIILKQTHY